MELNHWQRFRAAISLGHHRNACVSFCSASPTSSLRMCVWVCAVRRYAALSPYSVYDTHACARGSLFYGLRSRTAAAHLMCVFCCCHLSARFPPIFRLKILAENSRKNYNILVENVLFCVHDFGSLCDCCFSYANLAIAFVSLIGFCHFCLLINKPRVVRS